MVRETTTRIVDVTGALAVELLEARARGEERPTLELSLPYVSEKVARAAREFMARVAPGVSFALEGRDGSSATHLGVHRRRRRTTEASGAIAPGEIFTDLRQWMLKVLLLRPRQSKPASLRALAAATNTSLTTAQGFVETFRELGHLVDDDGYQIVRRGKLMRRWLASSEAWRELRIPMRAHFGVPQLLATLARRNRQCVTERASKSGCAALGGFSACEARGVLHVLTPGPMVLHLDGEGLAEGMQLAERCARSDADVLFVPSAAIAATVFRPLAWEDVREDVLPAVDMLQAALDVWTEPVGGEEQARYIIDEVLRFTDDAGV